ncbi:protein kinase [Aquihabitans daechungensis]|uniref:protein kinase domain-containing protein n=1 Tax=Aquihabitans daechungensis TaxID=1052257 RepID=UPI003B9F56DC
MDEPMPSAPEAQDPCPHCGQPVGDAWLVCAWCGTQIAAPAELPVGATLAGDRYRVIGTIGRGGFGITYEVGDTRLKRRVAVKELFPESAVRHGSMVLTPPQARASFRSARDRFLREARVLARFTHPGIVRVYEVFEEHGTAYLVMERLSGRTLVDVLRARNEPFAETEVVDVAARVAAALRPVHAAGVLHRDVNPSNVMLTEHGRIVVIDFGLARDFDQGQTMGMTRMVTPGYAPLEQYRGEGRFGPTTDIYGHAATCYRLATGRVPVAAVERDAGGDLPSPHRLNPAISKQVSDAILDGLELEPAHRPQDLDAFLARLGVRWLPESPRSVLLGTIGAEPPTWPPDPTRPARTRRPSPGSAARPRPLRPSSTRALRSRWRRPPRRRFPNRPRGSPPRSWAGRLLPPLRRSPPPQLRGRPRPPQQMTTPRPSRRPPPPIPIGRGCRAITEPVTRRAPPASRAATRPGRRRSDGAASSRRTRPRRDGRLRLVPAW